MMRISNTTPLIFFFIVCHEAWASNADVRSTLRGHQSQGRRQASASFQTRIIGGVDALPGQYPFYVKWAGCGASLIYKDLILSAAHCDVQANNLVRVGAYNSSGWQDGSTVKTIVNRTIHPLYNSSSTAYDYLVMKLDSAATQTPIALNGNSSDPVVGQDLTVIGFGTTSANSTVLPTILQQVVVNYVDDTTCKSIYGSNVDSNDFCAGVPQGGKDSCLGDSGGPIFDSAGYQVGIVSFGSGCAEAGYPGVYSRISGVINWIDEQICKLSAYPPASCFGSPAPASTSLPTMPPTLPPTNQPTSAPVTQVTPPPTKPPTKTPTKAPTKMPTKAPTKVPVNATPTKQPTKSPTKLPTKKPTKMPTKIPTKKPSTPPQTKPPTLQPTKPTRKKFLCLDTSKTFLVNGRQRHCSWLKEYFNSYSYLCNETQNNAATACPLTCSKC